MNDVICRKICDAVIHSWGDGGGADRMRMCWSLGVSGVGQSGVDHGGRNLQMTRMEILP